MRLTKVKLAGFKSFVDPAEVDGFVKHIISEAADNTEAWGAQNFKEIAAKRGINGDAPQFACFEIRAPRGV